MKTAELRKTFIEFYQKKGHEMVPGASTIPTGDQTILFTIAGMTQFKDILAGIVPPKFKRVTNSQKCIRAADLEDVGLDGRHLTMFEMLGLWSFGDYSKKESISWSWEFITQVLQLDTSKIWATVHTSDDESVDIWKATGLSHDRIVKLGDKDNFWAMGPTGPCGPCSEIYYDQGPSVGCTAGQGPTPFAVCKGPGCDCDRYLEFWNNVFMEFNRDEQGVLHPLPAKNVDTGVGLERLAAICQKKTSAYETDAFATLQAAVCLKIGLPSGVHVQSLPLADKQSVQVISDHMRTLVVTLADGATFSNEGRGYVLRRILRRAVRYANRLQENHHIQTNEPCLYLLAHDVATSLGDFYPELLAEAARVAELIHDEEGRFLKTLAIGLSHFKEKASKLEPGVSFSGEDVFILHDSFGFPADLTALLCKEAGLHPDLPAFEKHMEAQKERSRKSSRFYENDEKAFSPLNLESAKIVASSNDSKLSPEKTSTYVESTFTGYQLTTKLSELSSGLQKVCICALEAGKFFQTTGLDPTHYAAVTADAENARLYRLQQKSDSTEKNALHPLHNSVIAVIFQESPFYPEGGGQVADRGYIVFQKSFHHPNSEAIAFRVTAVSKTAHGIVHILESGSSDQFESALQSAPSVLFAPHIFLVDLKHRLSSARNHSATHLLHASLRHVLGTHVRQAGSHVSSDGLRFDFTHPKALTSEEIAQIENLVLDGIDSSHQVITHANVAIDQAKQMGALAMFDEKYDEMVRVLEIGPVSMELCGGIHVANTSQIGSFRITGESSVTTGVRRIEALTGRVLNEAARNDRRTLDEAAQNLKCSSEDLLSRIVLLRESERTKGRRIEELERKLASQTTESMQNQSVEIAPGLRLICTFIAKIESASQFESFGDTLKEQVKGIVVLGGVVDGKAQLLTLIHPDARKAYPQLSAGNLIKGIAPFIDGRGGGKPEFAKAGGLKIDGLEDALQNAPDLVKKMIAV